MNDLTKIDEKDLKKIKTLHVMLKMPIWVLDGETNEILKSYTSIYKYPIFYAFKKKMMSYDKITFYSGILNEIFLSFRYKNVKILMGAFRINNVSKKDFCLVYQNMTEENKKKLTEEECWKYYAALPVYPLGDIKEYLSLLGFLFDMDLENCYSDKLYEQVSKNQLELQKKRDMDNYYERFRIERYTLYYENKIMNLVSHGDLEELKKGLSELGTSVLPLLTSNSLKTEKNYTILILGKLSSLAIQMGKDVLPIIQLRNYYIRKLEQQTDFLGVLSVRDSAIIHFTKELHGISGYAKSSLMQCVLQYINLKIYENVKIGKLAEQFYLSESSLRRKFKEEIGMSVSEYMHHRKIEEAKMMIQSGIPIGEIAKKLGFYDFSHFYRTFKKYSGMTPQHFRDMIHISEIPPEQEL